jgi:hypothetical protein
MKRKKSAKICEAVEGGEMQEECRKAWAARSPNGTDIMPRYHL